MNFDFSALNFETIDSNINAYPDMFLNQNGVTFTKKVLEDLGYPAFVLCLLDAKARVFAIRSCKSNEPKGFKFSNFTVFTTLDFSTAFLLPHSQFTQQLSQSAAAHL